MDKPILLFHPYLPISARDRARAQMDTRWLGQGPAVDEFEIQFEKQISHSHKAIAVNSGTSALHLAYILAGIKDGDEVIGPVFTCSASYSGLLYQRAKVVFADINKDNLNINPDHVEELLKARGGRVKAILAVDYAGNLCDYTKLKAIAQKWNIPLIEDAAQSVGAKYQGQNVGEIVPYTCFSGNAPIIVKGGIKKIKDIKKGEEVLSSNGIYQKVLNTLKREYVGKWTEFRGTTISFTSTSEHPVFIYRNGSDKWIPAKDIKIGDYFYVATKLCLRCKKDLIPYYGKICSACYIKVQNSTSKRKNLSEFRYKGHKETSRLIHHEKWVIPQMKKFEENGYKVIPFAMVFPDFIAIKNGKVVAVEVESCTTIKYGKENKYEKIKPYKYDDVIWITREPKFKTSRYSYEIVGNLARIKVREVSTYTPLNNQHKPAKRFVYNLTVGGNHTYFAHQVLVHNCFSFQAIKTITTCDGGMLTIEDAMLEEKAKRIRWFGIDRKAKFEERWKKDIFEVGYKYQMTDVAATLGLEGLKELDSIIAQAKARFEAYQKGLEGIPGIKMLYKIEDGAEPSYWICTVEVDRRDDLKKKLAEHGIESNEVHFRCDRYTVYGGRVYNCPNMDYLEDRYLVLPMHHFVTMEDIQERIIPVIKSGW